MINELIKLGLMHSYFMRKANNYKRLSPLGIYYRFILRKLSYKYGFQIPAETKIGEGFYINHFGTVVINAATQIGKNFTTSHSVTIGQSNKGKRKGCPISKDNVWVGAGAILVGNIVVGSNVLIAPNSYVNIDIPNDSIVVGNPIKIISKLDATEGYINYGI